MTRIVIAVRKGLKRMNSRGRHLGACRMGIRSEGASAFAMLSQLSDHAARRRYFKAPSPAKPNNMSHAGPGSGTETGVIVSEPSE